MTTTKPKPARKPRSTTPATTEPEDRSRRLEMREEPGKAQARQIADLVTRGVATNAITAMRFVKPELGDLDLSEMAASLREDGAAVNAGDLASCERVLHAQAVSLNAMFCELARRAHVNMGEYMDSMETYLRLALKAQSQCRATLETLAAIKNPPVVYTRQMNVANGPQQVNNGGTESNGKQGPRTQETKTTPNELLQDQTHGSTQVDAGAAARAGRANPELVSVGAIDGAAK